MQNWLNPKQRESVDKNVKFFDSLDERQKSYYYDKFSDNKLKSHMNVTENGLSCIQSSDEYSPFYSGDYMIYSFEESGVFVQIAWSKFHKEIYICGYVSEKNGWYEWSEYHKIAGMNSAKEKMAKTNERKSFQETVREAKEKATIDREKIIFEKKCKAEKNGLNNSENRVEGKEHVGVPVIFESDDSLSNYRKISIPSVKNMQTLKNRLLAVRSFLNFDSSLKNKICVEGVGEAFIKNISERYKKTSVFQDYIYFVMYDGVNFVYFGDMR